MDEPSFQMFESFDFENNQHFQTGWRAIENLIDLDKKELEYLRAQAFYFTKNVKGFDYHQYLLWRKRKQSGQVKTEIVGCGDAEQEECLESGLSLAEVAELIQNNQPIPGIVSVDVKPSNAEPTPSKMNRKLKPWETTDSTSTAPKTQASTARDFSHVIP